MTTISRQHQRPASKHRTGSQPAGLTWLLDGTPLRSPWRLVAAVGAVGEAVAHVPVTQMHLTEAPYIGVGFVLLTIAGLILGGLLLVQDAAAVWVSSLVVSVLALAGYALSRTVGLPQIGDDIGNWTEPLGVVAIITETMMLVAAAAQLGRTRRH